MVSFGIMDIFFDYLGFVFQVILKGLYHGVNHLEATIWIYILCLELSSKHRTSNTNG